MEWKRLYTKAKKVQNRPDRAILLLEQAIDMKPSPQALAVLHIHAGLLHEKMNQDVEAIGQYRRAIIQHEILWKGHYHLGLLLRKNNHLIEAERYLNRAFDLHPEHPTIAHVLKSIQLQLEKETKRCIIRLEGLT